MDYSAEMLENIAETSVDIKVPYFDAAALQQRGAGWSPVALDDIDTYGRALFKIIMYAAALKQGQEEAKNPDSPAPTAVELDFTITITSDTIHPTTQTATERERTDPITAPDWRPDTLPSSMLEDVGLMGARVAFKIGENEKDLKDLLPNGAGYPSRDTNQRRRANSFWSLKILMENAFHVLNCR